MKNNNNKKNNSFYGCKISRSPYAQMGKVDSEVVTFGHIFTLDDAKKLKDSLSLSIAMCEMAEHYPELNLPKFNAIIMCSHLDSGQITILAKKRVKPLRKGIFEKRKPV